LEAQIPRLRVRWTQIGIPENVLAERNKRRGFGGVDGERITSRYACSWIVKSFGRGEYASQRTIRGHTGLRTQPVDGRIIVVTQTVRRSKRTAAIAFDIPGKTQSRRKVFPICIEKVRCRLGGIRSIIRQGKSGVFCPHDSRRAV